MEENATLSQIYPLGVEQNSFILCAVLMTLEFAFSLLR